MHLHSQATLFFSICTLSCYLRSYFIYFLIGLVRTASCFYFVINSSSSLSLDSVPAPASFQQHSWHVVSATSSSTRPKYSWLSALITCSRHADRLLIGCQIVYRSAYRVDTRHTPLRRTSDWFQLQKCARRHANVVSVNSMQHWDKAVTIEHARTKQYVFLIHFYSTYR